MGLGRIANFVAAVLPNPDSVEEILLVAVLIKIFRLNLSILCS